MAATPADASGARSAPLANGGHSGRERSDPMVVIRRVSGCNDRNPHPNISAAHGPRGPRPAHWATADPDPRSSGRPVPRRVSEPSEVAKTLRGWRMLAVALGIAGFKEFKAIFD